MVVPVDEPSAVGQGASGGVIPPAGGPGNLVEDAAPRSDVTIAPPRNIVRVEYAVALQSLLEDLFAGRLKAASVLSSAAADMAANAEFYDSQKGWPPTSRRTW